MGKRTSFRERLARLQGSTVYRDLDAFAPLVAEIAALEPEVRALDGDGLLARSQALRAEAQAGRPLDEIQARAYALVREAAHRALGLRPFDEQVMAALALHRGAVVEMQTGEGKTLAAVMPAYLAALAGKGVHVLTFNDYLARRDAEWMGPVYAALGLRADWVGGGRSPRRAAARLCRRRHLRHGQGGGLRPPPRPPGPRTSARWCIARSTSPSWTRRTRCWWTRRGCPLSSPARVERPASSSARLAEVVARLEPGLHFDQDEHGRNVELTETGFEQVERTLGCGDLLADANYTLLTELHCALHARALLHRDADYIVRDGRIQIVDEFTGRVVEDRHWPDGLQAALEAKEGLERRPDGRILGSMTLQHFLRSYPRLCGMTGTARDAAREIDEFYGLPVVVVPTHRPMIRVDEPDVVFTHVEAKEAAVVDEIRRAHAAGRPVLVGTLTIAESERLAARLREHGVACEVLNAAHDEREAAIVGEAGAPGAVTISTNMAGRGTDIRLGGADESRRAEVVAGGGLLVIGTNRHESQRVDLQLRGRAGRQGDPGSSRFFVSLEDPLLVRFGVEQLIPAGARPARQEGPVDGAVLRTEIARAQRIIEGQNLEIRRTLWRYAAAIEDQRLRVHARRQALLTGEEPPDVWPEEGERYEALVAAVGEAAVRRAETAVTLGHIDRAWSEYLSFVAELREGIHLVGLGGQDPLSRFKVQAAEAFRAMEDEVEASVRAALPDVTPGLDAEGLSVLDVKGPSSTWTYLINDDPFRNQLSAMLTGPGKATFAIGGAMFAMPLLVLLGIVDRYFRKRPRRH